MALKLSNDLFSNNFFTQTPEDGQVGIYSGNRIIPTDLPVSSDTVTLTSLESALNVLQLQVAAAITPGSYVGVEMDIFSDTTGYLNTVDTANTTAFFSTNKYMLPTDYSNVSQENGFSLTSNSSATTARGITIYAKFNSTLLTVTKHASATPTKCYIYDESSNLLDTQTFSGNVATFNLAMTAGQKYYINAGKDGASFTGYYTSLGGITYPQDRELIKFIAGCTTISEDTNYCWNILSVNVTVSTPPTFLKVQTNVQTLVAGFTHFQVVAFRGTVTGTGTITADISFDNGAHYQTGLAVNTNYSITNVGTQMIVKLNLNHGASLGTAESMGWGVQLW